MFVLVIGFMFLLTGCGNKHELAPVRDARHAPSPRSIRYIVRKGETLYSVAWRFELDYRQLAKLNHLQSPYTLYPGQLLHLKGPIHKKAKPTKQAKSRYFNVRNSHARVKKTSTINKKSKLHAASKTYKAKTAHNALKSKLAHTSHYTLKSKKSRKALKAKKVHNSKIVTRVTSTIIKSRHNSVQAKSTKGRVIKHKLVNKSSVKQSKITSLKKNSKKSRIKGINSRIKLSKSSQRQQHKRKTKLKQSVKHKHAETIWYWPTAGRVLRQFSLAENRKGIDIAGYKGQVIRAARNGVVAYCGNGLQGYGNLIIIRHDRGYLTAYAHNDRILVHEGNKVKAKQKIAEMGNGGARKALLHFEIRKAGKPVNPISYLGRYK